jgi:hypothetical protein
MTLRTHFERKLQELRDEILRMGRLVQDTAAACADSVGRSRRRYG